MRLVVFGCSHTAGSEMEYAGQTNCFAKAWPTLLAKKLDVEIENYAKSGMSQKAIFRKFIEYLPNIKREKPLLFIFAWPSYNRTDLHIDNPHNTWLNLTNYESTEVAIKRRRPAFSIEQAKLLLAYTYSYNKLITGTQNYTELMTYVISIQSLCNSYKIPYLMFNTASAISEDNALNSFSNQIDLNNYITGG